MGRGATGRADRGGALYAVFARERLPAILSLGASGISLALVFLTFAAPDVGITQLMIETLVVIFIVMVLTRLPRGERFRDTSTASRVVDISLGLGMGLSFTLLALAVINVPLDLFITEFYERAAHLEGHGRNVVNVILVDFRAFDTFGETMVVGIAGIGAYALLRLRPGRIPPAPVRAGRKAERSADR